jgi:hypothetical protein
MRDRVAGGGVLKILENLLIFSPYDYKNPFFTRIQYMSMT